MEIYFVVHFSLPLWSRRGSIIQIPGMMLWCLILPEFLGQSAKKKIKIKLSRGLISMHCYVMEVASCLILSFNFIPFPTKKRDIAINSNSIFQEFLLPSFSWASGRLSGSTNFWDYIMATSKELLVSHK